MGVLIPHASCFSCADLAAAVAAGKVSKEILQRYLALSQGLLAPFMRMECVPGPQALASLSGAHACRAELGPAVGQPVTALRQGRS